MKNGYCNGDDMLLLAEVTENVYKAVGSCTSHSIKLTTETKDIAVKPAASAPMSAGLWKDKNVTGLAYTISGEGLIFYNEAEFGFSDMLKLWKAGKPIRIKCIHRSGDAIPYLTGSVIITSLDLTAPAKDNCTYSINLENAGAPDTINESVFTGTPSGISERV